ncbi:MAG: non-heme iron oxygenase ferredoxin subunit [Chloroflexi bacterium]|nr:non-heme iron oxygenase ferredoxin subunit [Chloroflexota bacterium]
MPAFHKVAKTADVKDGQAKVVEIGDTRVLLCKVEGRICAIADICTHDGGPLGEGDLDGHEIICPRHGARFDVRTGAVLSFPAIMPVDAYPVMVDGDDVLVDVDA